MRIFKVLVVLAALTAISLGPASAQSPCPANTLCFYADDYFEGTVIATVTGPTWEWVPLASSLNDTMSSWINNTAYDATWSVDAFGSGTRYCLKAGSFNAKLIDTRDNQMSSYRVWGNANVC